MTLETRMKTVQNNITYLVDNTAAWESIYYGLVKIKKIPKSLPLTKFMKNPESWCRVYDITPVYEH